MIIDIKNGDCQVKSSKEEHDRVDNNTQKTGGRTKLSVIQCFAQPMMLRR